MDITTGFGPVVLGSSPGGCTDKTKSCLEWQLFVYCARRSIVSTRGSVIGAQKASSLIPRVAHTTESRTKGESITSISAKSRDPVSPTSNYCVILVYRLRPSIPRTHHKSKNPTSYACRTNAICASRENRTPVSSLARTCHTTKLYSLTATVYMFYWWFQDIEYI